MGAGAADANIRPQPDALLRRIADYVCGQPIESELALSTARYCLMDTIGCAALALKYPNCTRHLGPLLDNAGVAGGVRVPCTGYQLDPLRAVWNFGAMVRWLDYNDTWLAAEWGHPSDNLGAILPIADWLCRSGRGKLQMGDVLEAMVKAHEIQGVLALENSFNRQGLDHVILVKVASTAVISHMLGATPSQVTDAVSQAWVDGQSLRTYRHAPNAGSRKSWAAGDAASRAVHLSWLVLAGEPGCPGALTTPTWGFQDVLFDGKDIVLAREFASYVMENVLFKVSYPAEFHAQTAVEAACSLHPQLAGRLGEIDRIQIHTHEAAIRIISKTGPLANPADRDHCLQYMTAVGLLFGDLNADHYEEDVASDPRIDQLRDRMEVVEDTTYSRDYLDPDKRSIANRLQVFFTDGSSLPEVEVEYPRGHRRRRDEGIPLLQEKFRASMATLFAADRIQELERRCEDMQSLRTCPVDEFVDLLIP